MNEEPKQQLRTALVCVSEEFLVERLGLPSGTRVLDAQQDQFCAGLWLLKVEHESIDPVPVGYLIPRLKGICYSDGTVEWKQQDSA